MVWLRWPPSFVIVLLLNLDKRGEWSMDQAEYGRGYHHQSHKTTSFLGRKYCSKCERKTELEQAELMNVECKHSGSA